MRRKGFPRYIALAATVDDGALRWLPRRQRGIRARARQASAPTSACTELTRVIPEYPRESLPTRPRVKPGASVARRRVRASEVAAHWGSPSRKRRCCCAARKVSGWAEGARELPPAVGLARHSSLGRRARPCLGWRSHATGQRSLGSPLCIPRRQPWVSLWIPPLVPAAGRHSAARDRRLGGGEGGGYGPAPIRERAPFV